MEDNINHYLETQLWQREANGELVGAGFGTLWHEHPGVVAAEGEAERCLDFVAVLAHHLCDMKEIM